jgi:predicted MFS family arabinose efflux permease
MIGVDGRSARLALGTASALGLGRFSYGLLVPSMSQRLHWDLSRAGAVTAANGLGYLLGAMTTAMVVRAIGVSATFRLGMVVCAGSLAAGAAGSDFRALLAARAVTGFGGALVFIAGAVLARGVVFFAGAGIGIAVCGATIPLLLDENPERWPIVWIGLGIAAAAAAAISWPAASADPAGPPPTASPSRSDPLWNVLAAYVLFAAGYLAYLTFLSAYLAAHQASTARTALTWTVLGVAVAAAPALWQRHITRRPNGRTVATALAVLATAAMLPLLWSGPVMVAGSAMAYGATIMAVPAAVTAAVRVTTPPAHLAQTLAHWTVLFAAGQTVGPWLAGVVADRGTPDAALGWTAALCAAGAVVALLRISRER